MPFSGIRPRRASDVLMRSGGRGRGRAVAYSPRRVGAWRSLAARTLREGEVPGSNPGAPIACPEPPLGDQDALGQGLAETSLRVRKATDLRLRWRCELGGRVSVPRFRAGAEPLRRGGQREGARRARHRRPFRGAQQRQMTSRSAQTDPARVPVCPPGGAPAGSGSQWLGREHANLVTHVTLGRSDPC